VWEVADHFRLWLRAGMTGCEFAKRFAGKANQLAIAVDAEAELPPTDWLNSIFDANADADRAVIAVFPRITTEQALVDLINTLGRERWRVRRRAKTSPSGAALIGLDWVTKRGDVSETMGFAPFASMPVPRRAPYVAIATWPGGRSNPMRGKGSTPAGRDGVVSFLDAPHGLDGEQYEAHWENTMSRVSALMAIPPDDASLYRRAAFVVRSEFADRLALD
jgi:hypothetical protein